MEEKSTLLDIYAGMAMQTLLDKGTRFFLNENGAPSLVYEPFHELAARSFEIAEVMLKERAKRVGGMRNEV